MDKTKRKNFQKWLIDSVGIQDASIFSEGSMVEKVAIDYQESFKAALKEEIQKQINISQWDTYTKGLAKALDLIDQVKPLKS